MESFFNRLHERRECLKREEQSKRHQWRKTKYELEMQHASSQSRNLAILDLRHSFSLFKSKPKPLESLYHFGELHVSGDGLRFVDDSTEDVLVESPIEKISFCGPVENGKYFGYIGREEVDWKWICHTFKSTEDHADRINNAVGCAFRICLEKKHKARMEKQLKASSTAPPPQGFVGGVVAQPGTSATPTRTTGTSQSPSMVAPASIHSSQGPQAQVTLIDHFDLAWHSKTSKEART